MKKIFLITLLSLFAFNAYAEEHQGDAKTFKKYFVGWANVLKKAPIPEGDGTELTLAEIKTINFKWNHALKYQANNNQEWLTPAQIKKVGKANCLGYSTVKLYDAIAEGAKIPDSHIVVGCLAGIDCLKNPNAVHAVVEVKIKSGTYVMDNRFEEVQIAKDYFPSKFVPIYRINSAEWIQSMDGK